MYLRTFFNMEVSRCEDPGSHLPYHNHGSQVPHLQYRAYETLSKVPTFHITIMVPRFRTCSTGHMKRCPRFPPSISQSWFPGSAPAVQGYETLSKVPHLQYRDMKRCPRFRTSIASVPLLHYQFPQLHCK